MKMISRKASLALAGAALIVSAPALAATGDVKNAEDGSWITLTGTVAKQSAQGFVLDYGDGTVRVELDNEEKFNSRSLNLEGEVITVHGKMDDNFYHGRSIEADSIFISDEWTLITDPSPEDEEQSARYIEGWSYYTAPVEYDLAVSGKVSAVSTGGFTLDTGARRTEVDVTRLSYNPLDDLGFQQIDVGDRVQVAGEIQQNLFEDRTLYAESLTSLE